MVYACSKLWFFYKFYSKILYPITLNVDIKNNLYLLHPGINRYLAMSMAGKTHVAVRLFSTAEYKDIQQDFPLEDVRDAHSYQSVILCRLSCLPYHIVEVKNDKIKNFNYGHSLINRGVKVYDGNQFLFYIGDKLSPDSKIVQFKPTSNLIDSLRDILDQVEFTESNSFSLLD